MKLIYAWVALLVILIAGVGLFVIQWYTMPSAGKNELPKMRENLAHRYENRAQLLQDSAMAMANRIKARLGKLTSDQEAKINQLLDRAKELKLNAEKMKKKKIKDAEANEIIQSCYAIYGEASRICRQLATEANK
ncbi:MAG: hypothetical protein ABIK93_09360 [candidate division WOR-3 bacterium]